MSLNLASLLAIMFFFAPGAGADVAPPSFSSEKATTLSKLRTAVENESKALTDIDAKIRKAIAESRDIHLSEVGVKATNEAQRRLSRFNNTIESLDHDRDEHKARREVLNELIFQLDSKWTGGRARDFLETEALEMSITELNEPGQAKNPDSVGTKHWKFYSYLSIALREIAERQDNFSDFLSDFMQYTGVLNPRSPLSYLADRNYSSGKVSEKANPMDPEKAGDETDKKLTELGIPRTETPTLRYTPEVINKK